VAKRLWACVKALRALVVTFDKALCSDRDTVCLKDLTFLFIRRHKVWHDVYLWIAVVTASAGVQLNCCKNNIDVCYKY